MTSAECAAPRAPRRASPHRPWLALGVAVVSASIAATAGDAAVRYRRQGAATLGGADALAGSEIACEAGSGHVWVWVEDAGECVAYYPTAGLAGAATAIIFFEGDVPSSFRRNVERLEAHRASLLRALATLARRHGVPHVFVARPGTFGSTGDHAARRGRREYLVLDAAVTRIRERYRIGRLVLTGQSGGATAVGALLTLGRTDVVCATPASGGYDLAGMLDWHAERRGGGARHREQPASMSGYYDVLASADAVAPDRSRRIFVVADPEDTVTPFRLQRLFAERLAGLGHHARLVTARATGTDRHGLAQVGLRLAALCAAGAPDEAIEKAAGG